MAELTDTAPEIMMLVGKVYTDLESQGAFVYLVRKDLCFKFDPRQLEKILKKYALQVVPTSEIDAPLDILPDESVRVPSWKKPSDQ